MEPQNKIQVTVVRNDKVDSAKASSGLFVPTPSTAYDFKKFVGIAEVRLDRVAKIFLIGSSISHDELLALFEIHPDWEITVLDTPR